MERGIIKWRPFHSVTNTTVMLREENKKTGLKKMPVLSDDQINDLEKKIIFSFYSAKPISINYYKNGMVYTKNGSIKKIDDIKHTITLSDNTILFFNQIIKIQ